MTQTGVEEVSPTEEENRIPHSRVAEMVSKAKEEAAREAEERTQEALVQEREARLRLEGQMKALQEQKQAEKPPPTRAELQALVDEGRITQVQMDSELDRQQAARIEKLVEEKVGRIATQNQNTLEQQSVLTQYLQSHPDLAVKGSETQQKLQTEYTKLVAQGMPDNTATEIVALRLALGKPDKPKPVTRDHRDTDVELSGSGEAPSTDDTQSKAEAEAKRDFNDNQYRYYAKRIEQGAYKGWSDPQLVKERKQAARIKKAKEASR